MSWQPAFLATSVAIGEPLDDALAALGDEASHVAAIERVLRTGSREARARAIAHYLAPIVVELEVMEATWRG